MKTPPEHSFLASPKLHAAVLAGMTLVLADVRALAQPAAAGQSAEPAVLLTPVPSPKPRINSAAVFGVRPGSPFLFTVAATGERPMTFSAVGLPAGLKIDAQTGHITGSVTKAGEYPVTLSAKNQLGTAEKEFKIVCGSLIGLTPAMGWNS
jgi:alpha-galactosidase